MQDQELASLPPDARLGALLQAWNVALIDNELAPREEQLLGRFARGMGLSDAQASMAARNRRVILPLERLGIFAEQNPALFRFLDLCARTPGVSKIDHCTFVTACQYTELFLEHWAQRGFGPHGEWNTKRYPARHIALIRGRPAGFPWEEMVGQTVSVQPDNPIHRTMAPMQDDFDKTHQLQHIAINIAPEADMDAIKAHLEAQGVRFMTPVLTYDDNHGAGLRQMFTASAGRFFIEFAQRIPNAHGEPFSGFHTRIIDDLYEALDRSEEDWRALTPAQRAAHLHWLPTEVHFAREDAA